MKLKTKAKEKAMGKFAVQVELANNDDLILAAAGHIDPGKVRRVKLEGVVVAEIE